MGWVPQLAAVVAALRLRRMLRALMWTVLVVLAGCESRPAAFSGIDCGLAVESVNAPYDVEGRECVWNAYSSGTPVRWQVTSITIEGDPIRPTQATELWTFRRAPDGPWLLSAIQQTN